MTPTTLVIAPKCLEERLKKITSNILLVEPAQTYTHDDLTFETVASYNLNKNYHPKENGYTGYKLRIEDKYFYIMGDTDATPEALNTKCDVCFIPIGGTYTMDVFEASEYLNKTMPEIAIPIHYGSIVGDINLYKELEKLTNPNIKLEVYIK